MQDLEKPILFFDGECGLCQGSVRLLASIDCHKRLFFAPLQGLTAQRYVSAELRTSLNTVVFKPAGSHSNKTQSDAILSALKACHRCARVGAYGMESIPKKWRDAAYNWIAEKRHTLGPELCSQQPSKFVSRQLP